MIAINVLVCIALLLQPDRLTEASTFDTGRFQFLRRRTGSQVKGIEDAGNVANVMEPSEGHILNDPEPVSVPSRRFISFGPRKRTKSDAMPDPNLAPTPTPSSTFTFSGLLSNVVDTFVKLADSIDELELEHQYTCEQEEILMTNSHIMRREEAAKILKDKEKCEKYAEAFDHDDENDDEEDLSEVDSASGFSASESELESKIAGSVYDNDDLVSEDDLNYRSAASQSALDSLNREDDVVSMDDEADPDLTIFSNNPSTAVKNHLESPSFSLDGSPSNSISTLFALESIDKIPSDYVVLSDSDSETWEKVEKNMIDNVQVLVNKPDAADLLRSFSDQKSIIHFLASVFIKLARRIFFKPTPVQTLSRNGHSFEDFVFDFFTQEDEAKEMDGKNEILFRGHTFLDFETANRILFYNVAKDDQDDDWCLLLPDHEDFFLALEFLTHSLVNDLSQIDIDLERLPQRYYDFYAEKMGRERCEGDAIELQDKVRMILAFIMTFESKESASTSSPSPTLPSESPLTITSPVSHDRQILYTQGFDQIAAYFAINFDLDYAGPIAYRFFQLFLSELINFNSSELHIILRKIDGRAIELVRAFLKDRMGLTVLNFEPLFGILELYPFSITSATILYFTSATTWADLDRLIQFLLLKVPQDQAYKCVSLLAASNMLYSMLALDKLFVQELGSQEWTELKSLINKSDDNKKFEILNYLVNNFMGNIFLNLRDKIVHADKEFDEFLLVAELLVPYLKNFN